MGYNIDLINPEVSITLTPVDSESELVITCHGELMLFRQELADLPPTPANLDSGDAMWTLFHMIAHRRDVLRNAIDAYESNDRSGCSDSK